MSVMLTCEVCGHEAVENIVLDVSPRNQDFVSKAPLWVCLGCKPRAEKLARVVKNAMEMIYSIDTSVLRNPMIDADYFVKSFGFNPDHENYSKIKVVTSYALDATKKANEHLAKIAENLEAIKPTEAEKPKTSKPTRPKGKPAIEQPSAEELIALLKVMTMKQIGDKFGVSRSSVCWWMNSHGIRTGFGRKNGSGKRPSREVLEKMIELMPTTEVAIKFGVAHSTVSWWTKYYGLKPKGRAWWQRKRRGEKVEMRKAE